MSQFQFDATRVEPARPLDPLPTDWYLAKLADSELSLTKDKTGEYFNGEFQLMAGPFAGRKVFARHNTKNANAQAVEIGMREMSALCHATGVMQISDTTQLHERPIEIRVMYVPPEGQYDAKNEVRGYRAVGSGRNPAGNGVGASIPNPTPVAQHAPAAPGAFAPPPMQGFAPPPPPAPMAPPPPPMQAPQGYAPPPPMPQAPAPSFAPPSFPGAPQPQGAGYPPAAPAPMAPPPPPMQAAPPPPPPQPPRQLSPDGKYEWNGQQWLPVQGAQAAPVAQVPSAPAGGPTPSWAQR